MDRLKLSRIDEELESSEVAALCFLCCDVVSRKRLERVSIGDAKQLFLRLEEKGLLDNPVFLSQLLHTIRRADLLNLLETDSRQPEETDASPVLSTYRVMLYRIYEDMTEENLKNMKFLLNGKLGRRQIEASDTALDLFAEMEKAGLLSDTDVNELLATLREFDQQLALTVQLYKNSMRPPHSHTITVIFVMRRPRDAIFYCFYSADEGESVHTDAEISRETSSLPNEDYALTHIPRGLCVVINNESFRGLELSNRGGTQEDAKALRKVFYSLGFDVVIHDNLTADDMRHKLKELSRRNYSNEDALVVCVLSHGEQGCVFGTDEKKVSLRELTEPFTSKIAPTLTGKPKLFFIQACQGSGYQGGTVPCPPRPRNEEEVGETFEEDAGPVYGETVPWDADFLLGMATVQECKSFRNTSTGSIYIQELCKQLTRSAESSERDNILDVLTRVNREVGRGVYLSRKQMPEPKYTLTKRLVLKFVR
uniref:Caspase-8 n=1 Tax=Lates calcarifer TaxID=8187 RepID=A0A4W6C4F8_LATCA